MLKIQANCAPYKVQLKAEMDVVEAAQECADIYQAMLSDGVECKEIAEVMHDIVFIRDTIRTSGIRAYHYQFDKENRFAATYNVTPYQSGMGLAYAARLEKEYIEAATEGLKTWWAKFIEAIKNLWTKFITWVQTTLTFRNSYVEQVKNNKNDLETLDPEKKMAVMSCDSCDTIMTTVNKIHSVINRASQTNTFVSGVFKQDAVTFVCSELAADLARVGYELKFDMDNGTYSLDSTTDGLEGACPIEDKKLSELGFDARAAKLFVQDLIGIEDKSNFKKTAGKVEDVIKNALKNIEDSAKKADSDKESETTAEIVASIHSLNSFIRVLHKIVALENKLMVRALKTAIKLEESCKK